MDETSQPGTGYEDQAAEFIAAAERRAQLGGDVLTEDEAGCE